MNEETTTRQMKLGNLDPVYEATLKHEGMKYWVFNPNFIDRTYEIFQLEDFVAGRREGRFLIAKRPFFTDFTMILPHRIVDQVTTDRRFGYRKVQGVPFSSHAKGTIGGNNPPWIIGIELRSVNED